MPISAAEPLLEVAGLSAGYGKIDPEVAFLKLAALVEGTARASDQLWR